MNLLLACLGLLVFSGNYICYQRHFLSMDHNLEAATCLWVFAIDPGFPLGLILGSIISAIVSILQLLAKLDLWLQ